MIQSAREPERRAWLALMRVPGVGPVLGARLLDRFGTAESIFGAGPSRWRSEGFSAAVCSALAEPDWVGADADLRWLEGPARDFIPLTDPRYPPRLAGIAQAPLGLFCVGNTALLSQPQLAVVGARQASAQGLQNAEAFAAELVRRGLIVTSGLALGIDAAAHRGALDAGAQSAVGSSGSTIAVCANGLDRVYPAQHRQLAHQIASQGLLISEFPPGTPPRAEHFPRRNRVISGLALGVLVVEAARESGSLITARLAAEQGREVFAIPGSIHNPMARGCHALIREGARLVEAVDDILVEIAPQLSAILHRPTQFVVENLTSPHDPDSPAARILAALGADPIGFDQLISRTGMAPAELNSLLSELEITGEVAPGPGDSYLRLKHR